MFIEKIETPREAVVVGREIVPTDRQRGEGEEEGEQRLDGSKEKKTFLPLSEQIREEIESDLSDVSENEEDDSRLFYPFSSGALSGMRKDKQPTKVTLGQGEALYVLTVVNIGK